MPPVFTSAQVASCSLAVHRSANMLDGGGQLSTLSVAGCPMGWRSQSTCIMHAAELSKQTPSFAVCPIIQHTSMCHSPISSWFCSIQLSTKSFLCASFIGCETALHTIIAPCHAPKLLAELYGLVDDSLLGVVIAHLCVAGQREVLPQRVACEAVIRQDPARQQVAMHPEVRLK